MAATHTTDAPAADVVAHLLREGRSVVLSWEQTAALRGARVLIDGCLATLQGVCSCGCDQRDLQRSERYADLVDLERFVVQADYQISDRVAFTCVPASMLTAA